MFVDLVPVRAGGVGRAMAQVGERTFGLHGATAAQQALAEGLLGEIQVHLVPVLLGGGVRWFDLLGADPVELVRDRVVEAGSGVTHLRYHDERGVCRVYATPFDGARRTLSRKDPDFTRRYPAHQLRAADKELVSSADGEESVASPSAE